MPDPIISRNAAERTGAGPIMSAAQREIARRYRGANAEITAYIKRTGLSASDADLLIQQVGDILDRWIAEGSPEHFWYADDFTKQAIEKGVTASNLNLARLSTKYARERSIESILYSDAYLNRIRMARLADLSHFTGLSATAKSDMAGIIANAIADGKGVASTAKDISERLGVSLSRAKGYAQTQLPGALRDARMAESEYARENLGINIKLLWTSSLLPTTRPNHASRHGRTYTEREVKDFYDRDGNRFRCHCAVTECLIDDDGKPILSDSLKRGMAQEKAKWQSE